MATLLIEEVDVLKILCIHFDRKLKWSYMIKQLTTQQLGALFHVREYPLLGLHMCEYGNVSFIGASALYLHKLDPVQKAAEKLCQTTFQSFYPVIDQCHWSAVQAAGFPLSAATPDFLPRPYLCHTSPLLVICH